MTEKKVAQGIAQTFWAKEWYYNSFILILSFLTATLLWFNHHQVFDNASLQTLWQTKQNPTGAFQHFLSPFAAYDLSAAIWAALFSTASLWVFCRLSLLVNIGRQTTLILFLLLNFNPEFNSVRLQIDAIQPAILLWLVGIYGFLACKNIYLACGIWLINAWLCVLFEPFAIIWAIGFPLGLLFWTGGGKWKLRQRTQILGGYYFCIILLTLLIPTWREAVLPLWQSVSEQLALARHEMSFFISADNQFELSATDGLLLSAALVAINAIQIMGIIIAFLASFAVWRGLKSVFDYPIKCFFFYCLGFAWLIATISFMYYGFLPSDLVYTPITMLVLWLSSGAAFYVLQKLKNRRMRPERLLILFWIVIAYALASIISFGPSNDYLRAAGQWVEKTSPATGKVFSNHYAVLYYAGESPLPESENYLDLQYPLTNFYNLTPKDLVLHVQSRKKPLPETFPLFDVVKTFTNNRGDKVYALQLKNE